MQWIAHYFCPTVLWVLCVHMACWHVTWPLRGCFEMWVLLMFVIHHMHEKFISDMTEKVYQSAILKYNWNAERMVENIRARVAWELSWELWVEGNVQWIWNVSSERWRESAGRFGDITGTVRANIDVSIWRWLIHYVHTPKIRKLDMKTFPFNIKNNNTFR